MKGSQADGTRSGCFITHKLGEMWLRGKRALGSLECALNDSPRSRTQDEGCDYKWFTQDLTQGEECGGEAGSLARMLIRASLACGQPELHPAGEFWKKAENTPLRVSQVPVQKAAIFTQQTPIPSLLGGAFRDIHSQALPAYLGHGPSTLMWPRKNTQNRQVFEAAASRL